MVPEIEKDTMQKGCLLKDDCTEMLSSFSIYLIFPATKTCNVAQSLNKALKDYRYSRTKFYHDMSYFKVFGRLLQAHILCITLYVEVRDGLNSFLMSTYFSFMKLFHFGK